MSPVDSSKDHCAASCNTLSRSAPTSLRLTTSRLLATLRRIEPGAAIEHRAQHVVTSHALGQPHLLRDLRKLGTVHPVHEKGVPALRRQLADQAPNDLHLLCTRGFPIRCGSFPGFVAQAGIQRLLLAIAAPDPVDSEIGGGLEQESPQKADGAGILQAEQTHVRFLRNFLRFLNGAQTRGQELNERFVVLTEQTRDALGMVAASEISGALALAVPGHAMGHEVDRPCQCFMWAAPICFS